MNPVEQYQNEVAERNARLQALADVMKSYSDTGGDHHWQAAMEIERLLMIENLYLVSGRCVGDDDDTVSLVEGDGIQPFFEELRENGGDREVYVIYETRLGNAIDYRLKQSEVSDAN